MDNLRKNDIIEGNITAYTSEGLGVCRHEGRAVFVAGALIGERWRIRILKLTGSAIFGRGEELITPSSERETPACPLYPRCGGCDLMHMSYEEELRFKRSRVTDALKRIGGLCIEAEPLIPAADPYFYRNKAIYAIGEQDGRVVYGFYRSGTHEIIPVERCLLQNSAADAIAAAVCAFMEKHAIPPHDFHTGKGAVRHVFVRTARDGRAVCCIVSAHGLGAATSLLSPALREACPMLTGVVLNINKTPGNTVLFGDFHTLWGEAELTDTLCGSEFSIAPQAFYQVNPPQAEQLYRKAVELAAPNKGDTVLDLYCGAGTISLSLARLAGTVIGAEIVPEAIENAKENAVRNGVSNTEFICADAGAAAELLKKRGVTPAAVVVDPPRKGMSGEAVRAVAAMEPERIVYVSCDPATLARDLKLFAELGYETRSASPVDMFPRTCHVETVVLLTKPHFCAGNS